MNASEATAPGWAATDRRLRLAAMVVCLIGLLIAAYLTYVHYEKLKPVCLAGGGCETVQSSSYAKLAGIPVPVLGLVGYAGILLSLWLPGDTGRVAGFGMALVGFLFSGYLTYRELFTIKAICQWCVGSAVMMTILAIITTIRVIRADPPPLEPAPAPEAGEPTSGPRRAQRRSRPAASTGRQ